MFGGTLNGNLKDGFNKTDVYDLPCIRCGTCCSRFQPRLELPEVKLIAGKLGISWKSFLQDYTDPRWPGTTSFLLLQNNGVCLFLKSSTDNKQNLCLIHDFKPSCCLDWKSSLERRECREGLKTRWDLAVDSSGRISGSREKLAEFERFLQSLR